MSGKTMVLDALVIDSVEPIFSSNATCTREFTDKGGRSVNVNVQADFEGTDYASYRNALLKAKKITVTRSTDDGDGIVRAYKKVWKGTGAALVSLLPPLAITDKSDEADEPK